MYTSTNALIAASTGRFQPILEFERRPVDQPWLWREARLRDPDGNWLCLLRAGENRLVPPWRLAGMTPRIHERAGFDRVQLTDLC
jgi:hypothetical protein